ncbi:MAG TPA: alpha/beta hydrolase [Acidocella sp.]|nr:MAG: alpha/beta hydrolase [Acidocella sp. 21-58-7]HQT63496.1 alpha/beta hydrolase [Acidocella sp.]HQU04602.1 alpha/beta hydrolase [Acidocella sp.]
MPTAILDGISTRYEVVGEGPPLLMFSPGGFDATVEKWSSLGIYAKVKPLDHLTKHFKCILFDRRECGQSGGRVERITLGHFVKQAKALLDHLGIERAHLMGGCMGCSPVAAFALTHPERVMKMVLYWPVGGVKYRMSGQFRFAEHLGFVIRNGLQAVVDLVKETGKPFGGDPRGGPWASVIKNDAAFAQAYAALDIERYKITVVGMQQSLLDRDTVPGLVPEDLMLCDIPAFVVPGNDGFHATSAARYFQECLPKAEYWDVTVDNQTEAATAGKLLTFLQD